MQQTINEPDEQGKSVLFVAVRKASLAFVCWLVEKGGADVNGHQVDHGYGDRVLSQASNVAMVDYLLSKGADPTTWSAFDPTFTACVRTQSAEMVRRLLRGKRCMEI